MKLLATVSTPFVVLPRSNESVPSNTFSPNVELSERSSTNTDTVSLGVGVSVGVVVEETVVAGAVVVGMGVAVEVVGGDVGAVVFVKYGVGGVV